MPPGPLLSDAEWRVMNALWRRRPASVRAIHAETSPETGWAYTTVKTILARLAEKGAVRASSSGRRLVYEPVVSRDEARRGAVRSLLERAFDGAFGSLVHHLVEDEGLSEQERDELRRLLDEGSEPGRSEAP
jgi:predicted transcriptional regulator